VSIEGIVY